MFNFNFTRNRSFGIDLGNSNTVVADQDHRLLTQPSYIVFNTSNNSVKAVGDRAYDMYEKAHDELKPVKPLRDGVIADYNSATRMIEELVGQIYHRHFLRGFDHIIAGVPYHTTEVEKRALRDALEQFNSRNTYLVHEPLAAALGMGLNIKEPDGKLVIDIGGGISEIVVISLSGVAAFQSLKVAGDTFDMEIQDHFRRAYNMGIGKRTAEQIKIHVGAVTDKIEEVPDPVLVKGKDIITGIPVTRKIDHREVAEVLNKSISSIELGIVQTLESCPPELAADIYQNGIFVTGGSAMLRGLKERFESKMSLPIHIDQEPLYAVSKGVAMALRNPKHHRGILFE